MACTWASALTRQTPGTEYQQLTPSPTWGSSYSQTGSYPCSITTGCAWPQFTTSASTPLGCPR